MFEEFVYLGPVEKRDPKAHMTDPRGTIRSHSNGLSKREYFAIHILPELIAKFGKSTQQGDTVVLIPFAIQLADQLIAALKEEKSE